MAKLDGRLTESRRALKSCALEACPAAVQRDCVRWLDELAEQIPTVVFEAITDSGAAQRVRVSHEGRVLLEVLDGRPIELDPGYYEFSFELDDRASKVVSALLRQGEKNKLVSADFRQSVASATVNVAVPPATLHSEPRAREQPAAATDPADSHAAPIAVYATAGLALAAAATTVIFGINTRLQENAAYDECAPGCSEERIDSIKRSALVTDVAMGVAIASSLASLVLYWQRPRVDEALGRQSSTVRPTFNWQPAGVSAGLRGAF